MCIYRDVRKSGAFHIPIKKNWASHVLFVEKRGPIIYLAALKKGAIRHAHPYYGIYPLAALKKGGGAIRHAHPYYANAIKELDTLDDFPPFLPVETTLVTSCLHS